MFDFYQKRKLRTVVNSPITRIILAILVLLMAWSAFTRFQIASEMSERREIAEKEVEELQQQKAILEEKVEYLSDERGIEAEMRRQFDVALPDEQVVVIVETEDDGLRSMSSTTDDVSEPKWYQFWR